MHITSSLARGPTGSKVNSEERKLYSHEHPVQHIRQISRIMQLQVVTSILQPRPPLCMIASPTGVPLPRMVTDGDATSCLDKM